MTTAQAETLLDRASALLHAGRIGAARPVLAAARQALPPQPRLTALSALLDMRDGKLAAAREVLERDVSTWPQDIGLRKLRAELRMHMADMVGALHDAADCVLQAPQDASAKALLGVLLLETGQAADAVTCLLEAVAAAPDNPSFHQALAAAQEAMGEADQAAATLRAGIVAAPGHAALRHAAMLLAMRQGDFTQVVAVAEDARQRGLADACSFGLQGHALSSLGQHEEAAEAYREALKLGPDDPYVRHLVAASGMIAGAARAPDAYIRTVFNGYADRFESHLISLGYRVPGLVRAALLRHRPEVGRGQVIGPVLDLGCGTGLVGVALSDLAVQGLVGVDLSPRMLGLARAKGLYSALHTAEIGAFLAQDMALAPLIVAADVLCYFGDLAPPLAAITARLAVRGLCLFTVEEQQAGIDSPGWLLGRQGRFAHRSDYVTGCARAAGLQIRDLQRETLRQEAGAAVPGLLVVLERLQ